MWKAVGRRQFKFVIEKQYCLSIKMFHVIKIELINGDSERSNLGVGGLVRYAAIIGGIHTFYRSYHHKSQILTENTTKVMRKSP